MLPFADVVTVFYLPGQYVFEAFQNSIQFNQGLGRFLQASGIRYAYNPNQNVPINMRLLEIDVRQNGVWVRLDVNSFYQIVTVDYLREGGDGYSVIRDYCIDPLDGGPPLLEVVSNYFKSRSPIAYPTQAELYGCNSASLPMGS